jgi:hypothetical protein
LTIPLGRAPAIESEGHEVTETPRSFEGFFDETHQRLFGGRCLVTGDRHEAEEIMQDAYLKLWARWDRVGRMEDPTGWRRVGRAGFEPATRGLKASGRPRVVRTGETLGDVPSHRRKHRTLSAVCPLRSALLGSTSELAGKKSSR